MATHSDAIRNQLADLVVDSVDLGSGNPNGQLILLTALDAVVATLDLSNPAFNAAGTTTVGRCEANAITSDTNAVGGLATKYSFVDRDGVIIFQGTVGTSGAEILFDDNDFQPGDTVQINTFTYTASN